MNKEQEEEIKIQETGRQPTSNDSSSDTDKTSGSLFKTSGAGIELSRIKELPTSFYNGYASLDEFLSAASTSDNTNGNSSGGGNNVHTKRHHNRSFNSEKKISVIQNPSGVTSDNAPGNAGVKKSSGFKNNTQSSTVTGAKVKSGKVLEGEQHQGYAQDVIDEMNRQYDHNLCLDRFINDIEQRQQSKQKPQIPQTSVQQTQKEIDRTCNVSPLSSSLGSTCSSAVPRSNEDTDSGSRNSESVKSSTPENGKNEKEEHTTCTVTQRSNNEKSKKPKAEKNNKKLVVSDEGTPSGSIQFSVESGIELISSSPPDDNTEENSTADSVNGEKAKNYKGGKLGRKRKRGYIYNPKPVIEKPPKQFVPEQAKDQSYWDKRQRNNEAARRSREMRRLKEKETCDKLLRLKKENEALRVAITLLIQRNENLEIIIDEFEKPDNSQNARVPVTC